MTRVLVVDDDLNIQRVLVFTLKQEGFEVLVASDGVTGVQMARTAEPDLVLMDVSMPGLDGYTATQQIRAAEAQGQRVPIIILTSEADIEQRVRGLRAGADDDIVKPFHPLELIARIKALLARGGAASAKPGAAATTLGQLCCFYGAKGGVGTTTIVINAAFALASATKRRTAVIDANLQFGDHRVFLDLALDTASMVNAMTEPELDADLFRSFMVEREGVSFLMAPPNPESADIIAERVREDPGSLTRVLNIARRIYDYTLVDMVQTLDDFNLQLFDEADLIFLVLTADLSSLKNVRLVLETMDSLGYARDKVRLILNRSNAYTGINLRNAESALGRKIDHQIINEYRAAISALNSGMPFMLSRPDSPLGQTFTTLARDLDRHVAGEPAVAAGASGRR